MISTPLPHCPICNYWFACPLSMPNSIMDPPATGPNMASNLTGDGLYLQITVSSLSLYDQGVSPRVLETLMAHLLETQQGLYGAYCSNPYRTDDCEWGFCPQPDVSGECALVFPPSITTRLLIMIVI